MNEKYKFDLVSFGMRLKEIREFYDMTQKVLADELEVDVKSVSNWERGIKLPEIDNIVELAKLYNMSVGEILEDEPYRIFLKKATSRKRSIEIVEAEGLIEFYVEFTEDRYFDRYEAWIWDELSPNKHCCCTTSKVASYELFKKSILEDVGSIAASYRKLILDSTSDDAEEKTRREQLRMKMRCEQSGMSAKGAVFINGIVHYFENDEED
jgi:transcriptional regulator with XRE-family HTH domain